jgi:hypothetical protein
MRDLKMVYLVDGDVRTLIIPAQRAIDTIEWDGEVVAPAIYGARYFRASGKKSIKVLYSEEGFFVSPRVRAECRSCA